MARASTVTSLPLDEWAAISGINPVHFNGGRGFLFWPFGHSCDMAWRQYAYQEGADYYISREDTARLLRIAETEVAQLLGYPSRRETFTESHRVPPNGYVQLTRSRVISVGAHTLVPLALDAPVTTADLDGDNFVETCMVPVILSDADALYVAENPGDLVVAFAGKNGDARWRIRPLGPVELQDNNLTILFPIWLSVIPELWEMAPTDQGAEPIDMENPDSFVATVDVFLDKVPASTCKVHTLSPCYAHSTAVHDALVTDLDFSQGLVHIITPTCLVGTRITRAQITYDAGLTEPDPVLDRTVAMLATTRMPSTPCACNYVKNFYEEWHKDLAAGLPSVASNPFGHRAGEIQAWNLLARMAIGSQWQGGVL